MTSKTFCSLTVAAVLLSLLAGCGLPETPEDSQALAEGTADTEIDFVLRPARGDDYVSIYRYFDADSGILGETLAAALGVRDPYVLDYSDPIEEYGYAEIKDVSRQRLAERSGGQLVFRLDTGDLQQLLAARGVEEVLLTICHPTVEARIRSNRPYRDAVTCFPLGASWLVGRGQEPLSVEVRLVPRESRWRLFAAIVWGWFALWCVIAIAVGRVMRRDAPRAGRGIVGVAPLLALPGALIAFGIAAGVGMLAGPADNLALARDYDGGGFIAAGILPGALAILPVLMLFIVLVWRRPWRRGRDFRRARGDRAAPVWTPPFGPPPVP